MATTVEATGLAAALGALLRGEAIGPEHPEYDQARLIHNGMFDKRPALIARCTDAADVMAAVNFGREQGLDVAVRGGGHSAGFGTIDDGLVIDLAPIRYVQVDPEARVARVGGGTTLGDLDHATHAFGLAAPGGTVSTTGVAGLTLGGGVGYLTRKHGLSIDNLLGADVVLADGTFVQASEASNADLFWAIRGGGGNFGVVTEFRFRLHPVSMVYGGPMLWSIDDTETIGKLYREWLPAQADDVYAFMAVLTVPPGDPFPEEIRLRKVCALVWANTCSAEENEQALDTFRSAATPLMDGVMEMPLPALNSAFDPLLPFGTRMYWRGVITDDLPDPAIAEYMRFGESVPTWICQTHIYPIDGAAARVGSDETAWGWRDAKFSQVLVGVDHEAGRDDELRNWTVAYSEALAPYSLGGAYVNFMGADESQDRARAAFRGNYERLQQLKAKYDPQNVFHHNQNIRPA
jgi:FAD binding domain/Berberine and berberine like